MYNRNLIRALFPTHDFTIFYIVLRSLIATALGLQIRTTNSSFPNSVSAYALFGCRGRVLIFALTTLSLVRFAYFSVATCFPFRTVPHLFIFAGRARSLMLLLEVESES